MKRLKIKPYQSKYAPKLRDLEQGNRQIYEFSRHITESAECLDVFVASGLQNPIDYDAAVDIFDDAIKYYAQYCTDGLRGKTNSKFPRFTSTQKMQRIILSLQRDLLDSCPISRAKANTKLQEKLA